MSSWRDYPAPRRISHIHFPREHSGAVCMVLLPNTHSNVNWDQWAAQAQCLATAGHSQAGSLRGK